MNNESSRYEAGRTYEIGCGFYELKQTKSGLLKAEEISKDPECVKRRKLERKKKIRAGKAQNKKG